VEVAAGQLAALEPTWEVKVVGMRGEAVDMSASALITMACFIHASDCA